jgi:predicted enzyme related to lactoylglutathione lyase
MSEQQIVTEVDFAPVPTQNLDEAVRFYGEVLGMRRAVYNAERNYAEFEPGNVTFSVYMPEKMGMEFHANTNHYALRVDDVAAARAELESRGVEFEGDTFDTGVCRMAFFRDPDGNPLMLHHRYAPRVTES